MNKERLEKVLKRIENDPENFNYGSWLVVDGRATNFTFGTAAELHEFLAQNSCGAVGCIAGHAALEAARDPDYVVTTGDVSRLARDYLEVNQEVGDELFFGVMCPNSIMADADEAVECIRMWAAAQP